MAAKLLVSLTLLGLATAGPLSSRQASEITSSDTRDCALKCSGLQNKFQYLPDTAYIYQYEVNTETSVAGASEDSGVLNIQTYAEIEVVSSCEFSLHLKNTQVSHSDPYMGQLKTERDSEIQQFLQRNRLRFSFDDGVIKNVCPESNEEPWVLNFKRGLLSAFQNSMKNFDRNQKVPEVDVTGQCEEVEYNVSRLSWSWGRNNIVVSKSKNLLSCSKRDGFDSILHMVPYTVPSDIQSVPIIKSTHTCEQNINAEKILQSSSCAETHVYVPFSNYQSGERTVVTQKLTYQRKRTGIDTLQGVIQSRHSLLFQHTNEDRKTLRGQESAEQKLKEICEQTTLDIRPETPRLFIELVQVVKTLKISDLRGVYQKLRKKTICPQNEKAMKFFIDALPVAGTPGAVEMMLIVFKQDKVNEVEKQAWLLSLSLIKDPSDDMMPLVLKLLQEPMTLQALLPVSALVNNYCQKNVDCADNYHVSLLIDQLDENINFYCSVDDKNKQMVLRTLRAIGNIGRSRKFVSTINRCIQSTSAPIEVKLSAIEAYRRIPCPDVSLESDTTLVSTLQDKTAEPELRIASYQALMRCPTHNVLQLVVEQLNSEDNEEVGEYIFSHLNNLMKTSDPHKQDVAIALRGFNLEKKFEANILRSSRNYESSVLLNKFNLGYAADADLLWSKSSSLPRGFKANLTMELFGNSINLLDFGGRMEGMEYLITRLIGKNDFVTKKDKPWTDEDLRLCLYGRVFGNELAYKHIEGDKDLPKKDDLWNIPNLLINWSKKFNYEFTHSMQLFHGSMIVPTIIGLPLHITVNSSASAHLHLKGKVDMNKILTKHRSFNIDVDTLASAGLEVTGTMLVDAHFRKVGLRIRNTLHGNLPLKAQTSLSQAQGFSFELDAPEDKTELFDSRTTFFIISDSNEKEQKMITENRQEYKKCTGSSLAKITGFEMCAELQFPNASMKADAPYFPLTGPTSASVVLLKRDTHSGYKLFLKWVTKKHHTLAQFQLNTPGSQVNRLISTDVTLGHQRDKHIDVILTSPWKKLNLNGKLISNKSVKRMVGTMRVDEEDYGLTTEVKIDRRNNEVKYSPLVEVIYKGATMTFLSGQATQSPKKGHSVILHMKGMDKPIANIEAGVKSTNDPKRQKVSSTGKLKVKSSLVNADISSSTVMEKHLMNSRLKVVYDIEGLGTENIKWAGKYSDKSKKSFNQYKMSSTLSFKKHSDYNLQGFLDLHQKRDTKMALKMNYGKNFKNKGVTIDAQFPKSMENLKKPKVYGIMNLKVPEKKWDMKMEANHLLESGKMISSMDFQFLPFIDKGKITAQSKLNPKDFSLSANYADKSKKKLYSLDVQSKMRNWNAGRWSVKTTSPSRNVEARAYFRREKERITGDAVLNWDAGKKKKELSEVSVTGSYRNSRIKKGMLMKGSLELKSPFKNLENVNLKMNLDHQPDRLKSNGKVLWGGKHDSISVDLVSSLPLSLSQIKVLLAVKSPFKALRQFEMDIDHELKKDVMTVLRGKVNNAESEIKVKGSGDIDEKSRNLKGEISLRTPYKAYKEIKMTLDHKDDSKSYKTAAGLTHNSKSYKAEFDVMHDSNEKDTVNTGKLILTSPQESFETTWNHHIQKEMKKLVSKLTSSSKKKEIINFEASGSFEDISSVQLQMDMTTKWKTFRKGTFQLNHRLNEKLITSKAVFRKNKAKTGYDLHLLNDKDYSDVRINLFLNPLYRRDITLRLNIKHALYPVTASAQLEWAPRTKINFDGSLNAPSLDNFDLSSKLTTPFENYENIHVKSSVKKDSSELIAHLNIDYAIQKMIDIEARYRNDDLMKLVSAKLTSPSKYFESLDTALQLETNKKVNALKADFHLQSINTYGSQINLRRENADLSGKIKVISPVEGYNFMEANGWLRSKRDSKRTLHLDFKTDPSKDYSLDLSYKIKLPLQLNLNIKTPHPEFDNVGLVLNHDWSQARIASRGSVTYLPKQTVEVSLNLLISPKLDGSLSVKTPFENFEHNELNVLYDGKMHDFTSHGSVLVGGKKFSGDLKFKRTNYKISGELTLNNPYENVKGEFTLGGKVPNVRGKTFLQYGDKVLGIELSNILRKNSLKTDFKFITPSKDEFKFSIDHEDRTTRERRRIQHKHMWSFAGEETKLEATINHKNYENTQSVINLKSSCLTLFKNVSINLERKADFIDFSYIMDTKSKYVNDIGFIFKSSGPIDNMKSLLNMTWQDHSLLEVIVATSKKSDTEMDGKITVGGFLLPKVTSELTMVGDEYVFTSKSPSSDEDGIYHEVKYKQNKKATEWESHMRYKFYSTVRSDRVYFKRDLSDLFSLTTKWLTTIERTPSDSEVFGFEVGHEGNYDKFATTCDIHLGVHGIMKGKLDFFKDGLERIEMNAGFTSPFKGFEDQSIKFRFEGQDTRFSGTLNMAYNFNRKEIVTTLLMQTSPHKIFTFSVEDPKEGQTYLLVSSELEDGRATAKITMPNEMKFSLLAVNSDSIYPYHPHVHLVTPLPWLKDLTVNIQGQLLDGTADATLLLKETGKIEGKAVFQYTNPFSLTSSVSLDSPFENFQDLLLELKNTEDLISKKSVLNLALSDEKKISISGDLQSKEAYSKSKIDKQVLLDIKLPIENVRTMSLMMGLQADIDRVEAQMGFDLESEKVVDMELNYNIVDKKMVALTIRSPIPMEYSLTQNENEGMTENEIYINWNRDEPESNIKVISTFKDFSDSSKTDQAVSFSLVHTARSIGVQHSHLSSSSDVVSAGKLFWNTDDNSRLFYNLKLNDKSGRKFTFMNGELLVGGPLRTLGLSGSVRNNAGQQVSDVTFSWDVDNDKSKKVTLNTKVSGDEELNADISLKLPAEVQVNSKLILNKGNTIFDGTTDISYSWDDRKTLTLTSKLENNPGSYSLFSGRSPDRYNYSIQFGIKHPDTKVDMKFNSHVGQSDEFLTSSMGLDYLTSYRQEKNIALWLEIDKLKKQINLIGTNPYQNLGVTGTILSQDPLKVQAVAMADDEENLKATLDVDYALNKLHLGLGNPDTTIHLTAFYPNKSAFQVDIQHSASLEPHEDAALTMRLATPRLMTADLKWRPEMVEEAQNYLIQTISRESDELKTLLSEISIDVEKEVIRKYKALTSALSEDSKPLLDFAKQEMRIFLQHINMFERKWKRGVINNDLYLGDLVKTLDKLFDSVSLELLNIQKMTKTSVRDLMKPLNSLSEKLEALKNYPVRKAYQKLVSELLEKSTVKIDEMAQSLTESISDVNNQISELKEQSQVFVEKSTEVLTNHPLMKALMERLQLFRNLDISPQLQEVMTLLKNDFAQLKAVKILKEGSDEVYQQAKWVYNYWEIEENLPKLLQSSMVTLQEVAEEETKESLNHLVPYLRNPVVLFDPDTGLLKAVFNLPFDVERLDVMPDVIEVTKESATILQQYMIDLVQYWPESESNETRNSKPSSETDVVIDSKPFYNTDDSETWYW